MADSDVILGDVILGRTAREGEYRHRVIERRWRESGESARPKGPSGAATPPSCEPASG